MQGLPESVNVATSAQGVEFIAYDFLTPQPVYDGSFHYFRTCFHDRDEENSIKILSNTAAAIGAVSQLLIDEITLLNKGVHWWSACVDLHMYAILNALKRSVD